MGISLLFLLLWIFGETFTLIYVSLSNPWAIPLIFNYCTNIAMVSVILKFKIKPRKGVVRFDHDICKTDSKP